MALAKRSLALFRMPPAGHETGRRAQHATGKIARFATRTGAVLTTSLIAVIALPLSPAHAANAPTITAQQSSPGQSTSPSWSVVPDDLLAVTECRVTSGAVTITDWALCVGTYTADLSGQLDGSYVFEARTTDLVDSASSTDTYVLDRQGPSAPAIDSSPSSPSDDRSPQWSWTLPEGSGTCRLASSLTVLVDWEPCTSPRTFDLTGQPDGTYTFRVRATDDAGNLGTVASSPYDLDDTGPAAPTVSVVTSNPGQSTSVTWSWTGEASATAQCRLLQDGTPMGAFGACTTPHTEDLTGNPDGSYALEVTLTDTVGNPGATGSATYVLDRVAPGEPTIDSGPGSTGNDTTPTFTFSGAGASYRCQVDGPNGPGSFATCTSPYTPTLSDGDGSYTVHVRALDAAGNASTADSTSYVLDTVLPAAPSLSGPTGPSQNLAPVFTFTAEAGATTECRVIGPAGTSAWTTCTSPYTADFDDGDGSYTLRVRATDQAGNTGTFASASYVVDTAGPVAPTVNGPTGPSPTTSVSWTFSTEASATTECRLVGPGGAGGWAACSSPANRTLGQGDGDYTFEVRATDTANNLGAVGSSPTYTLDTAAPGAPGLSGPPSPDNDTTVTFTFTTDPGDTTECRLAGPTSTSAWALCTSPANRTLSQGDGTYTFEVLATDNAGNPGTPASVSYVLDTAAPGAPAVSGPATPGNSAAVTFTFSAEPGASTECQLAGPVSTSAWAACTSPANLTLGQGDGTYTYRVRATDQAGNTGGFGSALYRLDTTAPATPSVSAPSSPSSNASVNFTFTAEAGATTECRLTGPGGAGSWVACSSPANRTLGAGDGTYTFEVRATDAGGNTSSVGSASYVLDTTPPSAPTVTGPTGPSNNTLVTWTFTTDAQTTTECRRLRDGSPVTLWVSCTSPRNALLVGGDGTYVQEVRATDLAGNTGPVGSSVGYVLDTTAPVAPAVNAPASPSSTTTVSFTFSAEAGASTECQLEGPSSTGSWAACSSPAVRGLGQGDGTYTFRVRATDAAGNTSPIGSATYALDTTDPGPPSFTATPVSPGQGRSPSWSFTLPADGTGQCQLSRGGTVLQPYAACSSPYVADLTGADGSYTVSVRAIDLAGNTSASISSTYVLDTTGASAGTVSPPSGTASNDTTPTWTFTPENGATTECQVLLGSTVVVPRAACSSPFGADLSATGDGSYTFLVWATDDAGNTGTPATVTYDLDTVAPVAPTFTAEPSDVSSSRSPSWSFLTEPGATTQCRLTRDGSTPGSWFACTSPYVADLSGLLDGTFDLEVRAIDLAGNIGSAASSRYTLDTTPPAAPTLVSSPGTPSKVLTPGWAFAPEPGATTECQVTGPLGVVDDWTICTSPFTADLTDLPDGPYVFSVRATDIAGNTGPPLVVAYDLDSTVPAAPTITSAPVGPARDDTPTWTFTGEPGATFTCSVTRGTTTVVTPRPCSIRFTADLADEPDGTYRFNVFATDVSDNDSAVSMANYILDLSAPTAPTFTRRPSSPDTARHPTWSWTGVATATASCRLTRGSSTIVNWRDCTSPFVADLSGRIDGTYTLAVRLTDIAGNVSPTATASYVLDTTAPTAPKFTSRPPSPSGDRTPTWSWSDEKGAQAQCLVSRAGAVIRDWVNCSPSWTFNLGGHGDGTYRLSVRVTDAAGNTSSTARANYVLDSSSPPVPPPPTPEPPDNGNDGNNGGNKNPPRVPPGIDRVPQPVGPSVTVPRPGLKPDAKPDDDSGNRQTFSPTLPTVGDVPTVIGQVAVKSLEKPQFPLLLLVVVAVFLLVQNRIDRKDPKLATAPVDAEPTLGFGPVVGPA